MKPMKVLINVLCLLLVIFSACEKGNDAFPTISQAPNGKIALASFVHSSGAQTDFFQLANSSVVIQVTFPADDNPNLDAQKKYTETIHDMVAAEKTYAYIYTTIAGDNVIKEHLSAIKNADLLYKKAIENRALKSSIPLNAHKSSLATAENYTVAHSSVASGRIESCKGDYYNDNYGAGWFISNYCSFCETVPFFGTIMVPPVGGGGNYATNVTVPLDFTDNHASSSTYIMAAGFDADDYLTFTNTDLRSGAVSDYIIPKRHISYFSLGGYFDYQIWELMPNNWTYPVNTGCGRYHFAKSWVNF